MFQWTCTEGLKRADIAIAACRKRWRNRPPLLRHLSADADARHLRPLDFHPFLNDPVNVRMIKDIAQNYEKTPITLVLLGHEVTVPQELEHLTRD